MWCQKWCQLPCDLLWHQFARTVPEWIASKDKKTLQRTFDAITTSTAKLTPDTSCGILTRDFVRALRAEWLKAPGKRQGTTRSHSTVNHRLSTLSALREDCDMPPHTVKHLSTQGRNRKRHVSDAEVGALPGRLRGSKKKGAESMCALITLGLRSGHDSPSCWNLTGATCGRHEFGSRLSDKGESALTIMGSDGDGDISTAQVFVKASMDALRRAVGAAAPANSSSIHSTRGKT